MLAWSENIEFYVLLNVALIHHVLIRLNLKQKVIKIVLFVVIGIIGILKKTLNL